MSAKNNQPDWGKIAEKFDMWLPHIAPAGEALLAALDALPGESILDLVSGTGEPALTLARRLKGHATVDYPFGSFEEFWDTVEASDILKQQYDALPQNERAKVRDEVGRFARDFIHDGWLRVPHEYLIATGTK
ncbi:MAG: hypothetical protein ACYDBW_04950 [Sulfuricaulis sp.]